MFDSEKDIQHAAQRKAQRIVRHWMAANRTRMHHDRGWYVDRVNLPNGHVYELKGTLGWGLPGDGIYRVVPQSDPTVISPRENEIPISATAKTIWVSPSVIDYATFIADLPALEQAMHNQIACPPPSARLVAARNIILAARNGAQSPAAATVAAPSTGQSPPNRSPRQEQLMVL